jgi:hypothetical protein
MTSSVDGVSKQMTCAADSPKRIKQTTPIPEPPRSKRPKASRESRDTSQLNLKAQVGVKPTTDIVVVETVTPVRKGEGTNTSGTEEIGTEENGTEENGVEKNGVEENGVEENDVEENDVKKEDTVVSTTDNADIRVANADITAEAKKLSPLNRLLEIVGA